MGCLPCPHHCPPGSGKGGGALVVAGLVLVGVACALGRLVEAVDPPVNAALGYVRPVCIALVVLVVAAVLGWRLVTAPARRRERERVAAVRAGWREQDRQRQAVALAERRGTALGASRARALPAAAVFVVDETAQAVRVDETAELLRRARRVA